MHTYRRNGIVRSVIPKMKPIATQVVMRENDDVVVKMNMDPMVF